MKSKAYYSERVGVIQGQIASKSSELEALRGELDQALHLMNMAPVQEPAPEPVKAKKK